MEQQAQEEHGAHCILSRSVRPSLLSWCACANFFCHDLNFFFGMPATLSTDHRSRVRSSSILQNSKAFRTSEASRWPIYSAFLRCAVRLWVVPETKKGGRASLRLATNGSTLQRGRSTCAALEHRVSAGMRHRSGFSCVTEVNHGPEKRCVLSERELHSQDQKLTQNLKMDRHHAKFLPCAHHRKFGLSVLGTERLSKP